MRSVGFILPFLISAIYIHKWSASFSGRFTPGTRAHGTHKTGGWVDMKKRQFLLLPGLELRPSAISIALSRLINASQNGRDWPRFCDCFHVARAALAGSPASCLSASAPQTDRVQLQGDQLRH
jgi:hypothetical protein